MPPKSHSATTDLLTFEDGILPSKIRPVLLLNKTTILDVLDADGVLTLSASFEGLPFGCYLEKFESLGPVGAQELPAGKIRYASPGRRSRFRHTRTYIHLALTAMLEDMLGDAWESITAIEGSLRIDVAGRALIVSGRGHDRQFHRVY